MKSDTHNFRSGVFPLFISLLCIPFLSAVAQPTDDNGLLYFPPKLKVEVSTDESWWLRAFSMAGMSELPKPKLQNRIVFTKNISPNSLLPLPMIFFDPGSYNIPERYQQFTGTAQTDAYVDSAEIDSRVENQMKADMLKYYEILNIIGYRLNNSPGVSISLEGGYSTEPGENAELAAERAQVVKEYLTNIWHIEPERVALLPPRRLCDPEANILKQEEARRVVIYSDSLSLFHSVEYRTARAPSPFLVFSIVLDPQMSPQEVTAIDLVIAAGDDIIGKASIPVSPDSSIYQAVGLGMIPRRLEDIEDGIVVQAFVQTQGGTIRSSNQVSLPVTIKTMTAEDYAEAYEAEHSDAEQYYEEQEEAETGDAFGGDEVADSGTYTDMEEEISVDTTSPWYQYSMARYYYTSIPFYESGDTALSPMQQMWINTALDSIKQCMAASPEVRWEIGLTGSGEDGEFPEAADEQIAIQRSTFRRVSSYYSDLMEDRSFHTGLYFFPLHSPQTREEADVDVEVNTVLSAVYGDRIQEMNSLQKEYTQLYKGRVFTEEQSARIDTFLAHRCDGIGSIFRTILDTSHIDTVTIDGRTGTMGLQFADTPEERFYKRSVMINFSPNYQRFYDQPYNEENYYDEEYDGEEEYEEGEYEEEEYEEYEEGELMEEEEYEEEEEGAEDPNETDPEKEHEESEGNP